MVRREPLILGQIDRERKGYFKAERLCCVIEPGILGFVIPEMNSSML